MASTGHFVGSAKSKDQFGNQLERDSNFQVNLPRSRHLAGGDHIIDSWCFWLPAQLHIGLVGRAIAFALVTQGAGAYGVAPGVLTAPANWQDMVHRKVLPGQHLPSLGLAGLDTAVGTGVLIAL